MSGLLYVIIVKEFPCTVYMGSTYFHLSLSEDFYENCCYLDRVDTRFLLSCGQKQTRKH